MSIRRAFTLLVRLYPSDYRTVFGDEILLVLEQIENDRRGQGRIALLRFIVAECVDLLLRLAPEWLAKLMYETYRSANLIRTISYTAAVIATVVYAMGRSSSSFRSRCKRDPRMLRPAGVSWQSWYGAQTELSQN